MNAAPEHFLNKHPQYKLGGKDHKRFCEIVEDIAESNENQSSLWLQETAHKIFEADKMDKKSQFQVPGELYWADRDKTISENLRDLADAIEAAEVKPETVVMITSGTDQITAVNGMGEICDSDMIVSTLVKAQHIMMHAFMPHGNLIESEPKTCEEPEID